MIDGFSILIILGIPALYTGVLKICIRDDNMLRTDSQTLIMYDNEYSDIASMNFRLEFLKIAHKFIRTNK